MNDAPDTGWVKETEVRPDFRFGSYSGKHRKSSRPDGPESR